MIQVFGFNAILTGLSQERIHFFLRAKLPRFLRLFDPEDGGNTPLWNVSNYLSVDTA